MKKLSEVCKIIGITRRSLQEYARIDLLKPTCKTENGYWLYDDIALQYLQGDSQSEDLVGNTQVRFH